MNIFENVPAAICAVSVIVLVVLGLITFWADRTHRGEIFFKVTVFIVIFIPIMMVTVLGELLQTWIEKIPVLWIILYILGILIAIIVDSGSALAGALLGGIAGLIYVPVIWHLGGVRTLEEALLLLAKFAIAGGVGLALMSLKPQRSTKTKP